jgi:hypothetical protein
VQAYVIGPGLLPSPRIAHGEVNGGLSSPRCRTLRITLAQSRRAAANSTR